MLGAIYIGLSGMRAYSRGLQTISNNVANLNSPGFKSTSVRFADAFNRQGGGPLYAGLGSAYAGSGVRFGQGSVNFTDGDMREGNSPLDMGITGRGFLVLLDGDKTYYARTGSFKVDENGYMVEELTGYRLAIRNSSGEAEAINIENRLHRHSTTSTKINITGNLSTTSNVNAAITGVKVYDSNGGSHTWNVTLAAGTTTGEWNVTVVDEKGVTVGTSVLKTNGAGVVDLTTAVFTVTSSPVGAPPFTVELDFSAIRNNAGSSELTAVGDGFAQGDLQSVTITEEGEVKLTYTNGEEEIAGSLALADFRNPQDLDQIGNGLFRNSKGLQARILTSGAGGAGTIESGQLEASNVDLSQEFGDLILVQRGFQASSQVVSVSNDMIQQLFGIRGQG